MHKADSKKLGFLLTLVGVVILLIPAVSTKLQTQQLSIGLGVSHRDEAVSVGVGWSSFEVARVYNTGDEDYTLNTEWRTTESTYDTDPVIKVVPSSREVEQGESFIVTCEVISTGEGTIEGVAELQVVPKSEPQPQGDTGGSVVPGAELPFTVTVTRDIEPEVRMPYVYLIGACVVALGLYQLWKTQ